MLRAHSQPFFFAPQNIDNRCVPFFSCCFCSPKILCDFCVTHAAALEKSAHTVRSANMAIISCYCTWNLRWNRRKKGPNTINPVRLNGCLLCTNWSALAHHTCSFFNRVHFNHFISSDPGAFFYAHNMLVSISISFICCFVCRHQYLRFNKLFRFCISPSLFINKSKRSKHTKCFH